MLIVAAGSDRDPGSASAPERPRLDLASPFTRTQALKSGLTDGALEGPGFRRLFQGIYVSAAVIVSTEVLARAALLAAPGGSFISHHTAAKLLGGTVPDDPATHITCPAQRPRRAGLTAHRKPKWAQPTRRNGLLISSPEQCFRELAAAGLGLVDLVALGDAFVQQKRLTPEALVVAAASWRGQGSGLARRAAGFVRAGVRSRMESRVRMLLVLAGLPEPIIDYELRDEKGETRRYLDLAYPTFLLAIEYDGRQHAEDPEQWESDIFRREELDRDKWRVVVVTSRGVYREPARTLSRVMQAMRDQGMPLPRRLSEEWRRHFPTEELVRRPA